MHELRTSDQLPARLTIGALVFVLSCLFSSARLIVDAPTPSSLKDPTTDIAKNCDQRFATLKASLPEHGVVGYIGEPVAALPGYHYFLTQYALAPLVVDHSTNHPLVVGNFPVSLIPVAPSDHLRLVKDFGDGVLLFANKDSQ
jgi:hypothetical protein